MVDKVAAARRTIYDLAKPIRSTVVEDLLKDFSGVPTMVGSQNLMTYIPNLYSIRMPL
jgi:hypothetical protein